ncbi:homeobox-leucine zipper protein HOX3-like [Oryza glaberrima]|uniref:homeobox-leucine zipper protein HOX3-like n=1 Tax=Oryza glaberrima TaxID=4538 RepID=UPI00224C42B4|nr:homeobox-leucine zipper protein HOX3-like [Oryza glaberrima]
MEPMGILKCPSSLKLSVAVPGHALNPFSDGGSGSGCNNNNTRELGIHLDLDRPYAREELPQQGGSMEKEKEELADRLNLRISQVDAWFRNRRLRSKQKSTEMECAYLKECFNKLKEENHRLQLQVEQLRSTSLQLQLQLQLHSERVATAPTGQQAGTSAAARIFTLPLSGYNPSRGTWFSPNAH